ncbi:MAG: GldG family protein [bacterium]|nr:GldG family protein [bacterium]
MRQQAIRYTAAGMVGIVLAIGLTIMVNWLGARHWITPDWTRSQFYTLSEKSLNIIDGLESDIEIVVFMTQGSPLFKQVQELLSRYEAASNKISVEFIDPDREPLRTQQLAEQYGISMANTAVFIQGERTKYVTSDQMADYDYSGMQYGQPATLRAFKGEEQFTSAILSLVAPEVPKVYFVTGHGEIGLDAMSSVTSRTLQMLEESLKRENMEVAEVSLLSGQVPDDAGVLAIIGPTAQFAPHEVNLLRDFLADGGRLLVCIDPLIDQSGVMRQTGLEALLADHGIGIRDDLVVDPSRRLPFFDLSAVYLQDFGIHPITTGLEGMAALFPVARSLENLTDPQWATTVLVETSSEGWGETNLRQLLNGEPVAPDGIDELGPVAVGIVSEPATPAAGMAEGDESAPPGNGFRLVVLGDSDFLTDAQASNAGNLTLVLNAFNWLTTREGSLGIPPRAVDQVNLYLSSQQLRNIFILIIILLPGAAIALGILVWRRRRH